MHKFFRYILITSLFVFMLAGQNLTVLAQGPGSSGPGSSGPGVPDTAETSDSGAPAETESPKGPGYSTSNGPGAQTSAGPGVQGSAGPGVQGPAGPGVQDPAGPGTATQTPAEQQQTEPEVQTAVAADVQQRIDSTVLSVTVLRPDPAWTNALFATPTGDGLIAENGFISICVDHTSLPGDVMYRTYASATGWSRWCMNGEQSPWTNGVLIEAIQVRLKGVLNDYYDVSYRSTLSDGTLCGWSYNGRTNGTMATGKYITALEFYLTHKGDYSTAVSANEVVCAAGYDGIRFENGVATYVNGTGEPFTGWAFNGNDCYYFVNSAALTGWQYLDGYKYYFDETGKRIEDLEPIIGAEGPFLIKVNKQMNCTTIYAQDGENGFIIPLKSFLCSTGADTPIGTFRSPEKYRWHEMIHGVYCQYLTRLGPGLHILLHSPVYSAANPFSLDTDTYNYMGIARSAGCIRFVTGDCKWIYEHCPLGTTIQVYNSSIPGPYERPNVPQLISLEQTWDPTDAEAVAQLAAQAQQ